MLRAAPEAREQEIEIAHMYALLPSQHGSRGYKDTKLQLEEQRVRLDHSYHMGDYHVRAMLIKTDALTKKRGRSDQGASGFRGVNS